MRWFIIGALIIAGGCSNRTDAPVLPRALNIGDNQTVFVGTTRKLDETGVYGIGRSRDLQLLELEISIPPKRTLGSISDGFDKPNPTKDFVIAAQNRFAKPRDFQTALRQSYDAQREVTVFVHGYNYSFSDSSFRLAQLAHDLELPSTMVSYSWPSRGHVLGYEYDSDSALFARDGLQELLQTVKASGASSIVLVAHSMGGNLAMETLRQMEIKEPGWSAENLSSVVLISPDINVDVFLSQARAFKKLPEPFIVFKSRADKALKFSARLRWEEARLGSVEDISEFAHLPIEFVDVTAFTDAGGGNHFTAGSSPALIALLKSAGRLDRQFLSGETGSAGLLPGRKRVLRNATQIIVSPGSDR
ncbi:alpha/beta fold hydrolase [Pseudosulfitobacter sp. SM2401]|uniref:alpha/beta hydrolase n=1 Tax=Pseudosulfitobacter sp. SM2401 TaxID=3350098 RepID=UPI0036F44E9C